MHIKSSHAEDNAEQRITGSTRQHIISRLHKAVTHANKLAELLKDRQTTQASDNDYLEARAYAQCLAGAEEFERQSSHRREDPAAAWRQCLVRFSEAHIIYTALLLASKNDLFKEVIGGTVDPSIRYAAYQSRLPRTIAISTVAKEHFPRDEAEVLKLVVKLNPAAFGDDKVEVTTSENGTSNTVAIPTSISWRGRTAPIADAAIGQALAATSIATSNLATAFQIGTSHTDTNDVSKSVPTDSKTLAAAYDPVLTAAQDTVDAIRRSISDLAKEGVPESDTRMQDLRVSDLAANYALISWRIGRNRVLISSSGTQDDGLEVDSERNHPARKVKKTKIQHTVKADSKGRRMTRLAERVVLYDATLQSIDSVKDLRGAARDSNFMTELDSKRAYFQALKCINVGYSHVIVSAHSEALALFARAQSLVTSISASDDSTASGHDAKPLSLDVRSTQVDSLKEHLELLVLRQRGLVALKHQMGDNDSKLPSGSGLPVSERLQEFPLSGKVDLSNIVTWPPRVQPVPVKPIFLDLAWNYIDYPGQGVSDDMVDGDSQPMEGVVSGVVETAKQATSAVLEATGASTSDTKDTPKKRGWFSFGRG